MLQVICLDIAQTQWISELRIVLLVQIVYQLLQSVKFDSFNALELEFKLKVAQMLKTL